MSRPSTRSRAAARASASWEIQSAVEKALGEERIRQHLPRLFEIQSMVRVSRGYVARVQLLLTGTEASIEKVRLDIPDHGWRRESPVARRLRMRATWPTGSGDVEEVASPDVSAVLQLLARVHRSAIRGREPAEVGLRFHRDGRIEITSSPATPTPRLLPRS